MNMLFTMLILALSISVAGAETYRWVDEKGAVTFSDTPPPPSKKRGKVKVYGSDEPSAETAKAATPTAAQEAAPSASPSPSAPAKQERFSGTVEIYVTSWCRYCKQAISYMKSKGIPYVAYDVEKDSAAKKRHKELGGRGVPLIIIGSRSMSGFSPEVLESHLAGK